MDPDKIVLKVWLLFILMFHCLEAAAHGPYTKKFASSNELYEYANTKGRKGDSYLLEEPNTLAQIVTFDESGSSTQASRECQDSFLNKLNNRNMKNYVKLSKSFRKLQDAYEDLAYFGPLGKIFGPVATATNIITGIVNENNDKVMHKLYHTVRNVFQLNGREVTPDYNHKPEQKIEQKKPKLSEEDERRQTAENLDTLEDLLA